MSAELKTLKVNTFYYAHHGMRIALHLASLWWLLEMGFHWAGLALLVANFGLERFRSRWGFIAIFHTKHSKPVVFFNLCSGSWAAANFKVARLLGPLFIVITTVLLMSKRISIRRFMDFTKPIMDGC